MVGKADRGDGVSVIYGLLAASLLVALVFLVLFIKSVKEGQYDDTWSPSRRMLIDDDPVDNETKKEKEGKRTHD